MLLKCDIFCFSCFSSFQFSIRNHHLIRFKILSSQVSVDELKALLAKYSSTDQLAQSGVTIAGTRYMYLSSTDKVVRAKKGTSGVHTIKTTQALIVCCYEEPVVPEQAATVTEKLGEYLISVGY